MRKQIIALSLVVLAFAAITFNPVSKTSAQSQSKKTFTIANETHSKAKMMRVPLPSNDNTSMKITSTGSESATESGFTTSNTLEAESCGTDSVWDFRFRGRANGNNQGKEISFGLKEGNRKVELLAFKVLPEGLMYIRRHPSVHIALDPNFNSGALYMFTTIPFGTDGWTKTITVNLNMMEHDFMGCLTFTTSVINPENSNGTVEIDFEAMVVTRLGDGDIPTERPCGPAKSCSQECVTVCLQTPEWWADELCSYCAITVWIDDIHTLPSNSQQIKNWLRDRSTPYARLRASYIAAQLAVHRFDCNGLQRLPIAESSLICYGIEPIEGITTFGSAMQAAGRALRTNNTQQVSNALNVWHKLNGGQALVGTTCVQR